MLNLRTNVLVLVLGAAIALSSAACVSNTRGAIMNGTDAPISVKLEAEGKSVSFDKIAPNTTSAFQKLPFETLKGILITISEGAAKGGNLDFTKTHDHTVTVTKDAPPTTESKKNPDNTFW